MNIARKALPWMLLLLLGIGILYPNPYGNNPDVILDESYFLSSALSAIQGHTLPGWIRTSSTAYYGGPQAYVDTIALVPVLGTVIAASHFSLAAAKFWIAENTGTLLHLLRLVNGATALAAIIWCYWYFRKRKIPEALGRILTLYLSLLGSDALVMQFLHTAKMWPYYIIIVSTTGALFLTQEYYERRLHMPFFSKPVYAGLLIWSAILTFFQSYFGVFSICLFALYALLLGHLSAADLWRHVRRYWLLIALFASTQVSFLYQAFSISHQLGDASIKTAAGSIDWAARLGTPIWYAIEGQPLSLLFVVSIVALIGLYFYKRSFFADSRRSSILLIAAAHPFFTYAFFYLIVGLDLLPRYGVVLTIAVSFSITIFLSEFSTRWMNAALALSTLLFVVITVHSVFLYWQPSSETALLQSIESRYNSPQEVFITDHSARRMTLPINYDSLAYLDQTRASMGRFSYLLQNPDLLKRESWFKPITMTAYLDQEEAADIAGFATTSKSVWIISSDCASRCAAAETDAGMCFEINTSSCNLQTQEVNTLPVFLSATQLGFPYVVRRVH